MTSIAEKYAAQWLPNGEVSLADLIQAAVDEQAETHAMDLRAYEATVQNLEQRIDELTGVRLTVGDGLEVYGTYEAIRRAQAFIFLDSSNPSEAKDTARHFASALQVAEQRIRQLEAQSVPVVGEPVAWVVNTPIRNLHFSKSEEIGLGGATQEPLYRASTHSITSAELASLLAQAARLEQVEKERDEAYAIIDQCQVVSTRCKRYMDERETAQKNAQRYRWLREHWFTMTSVYGNNGTVKFQINQTRYSTATESTLDAAIDAAIAQEKGE